MKSISLTLLLLVINLTASFAQIGDTQCYTQEELHKIADKIVYANECDTLLKTCEQQLQLKDSANSELKLANQAKDTVIAMQADIQELTKLIIDGKNNEITGLHKIIKKEKRKNTGLKIGWATTSVVLTGLLTYFIIN